MKRRAFLKMMAALGAVPSLTMLKPAPRTDFYLGHSWSANFYVSDHDKSLRIENAKRLIDQGIELPHPEYFLGNTNFLEYVDPDAPSWKVLT